MAMNEKGISLIFAIIILLIFGLLAAVLASLVSTDADIAFHEFRSAQAQYVADGGIEYALKTGIFPNYSLPAYSTRGATPSIPLGDGSFVVDPPTVVTDNPLTVGATTINVVSTAGFAPVGRIVIDSEQIDYTGTTPTSFTGATRGVGKPTATTPAIHLRNASVYPATTLNALLSPLETGVITAATTVGFLPVGMVRIDSEYIYYTGTTATTFTGLTRCYRNSCVAPPAHQKDRTVFQYVITSTGTVPTGIIGNAQRVVRVTVGQ